MVPAERGCPSRSASSEPAGWEFSNRLSLLADAVLETGHPTMDSDALRLSQPRSGAAGIPLGFLAGKIRFRGSAPAPGAVFRALAENPGCTTSGQVRLRISRTGCRARGTPGYARGGCAPHANFPKIYLISHASVWV